MSLGRSSDSAHLQQETVRRVRAAKLKSIAAAAPRRRWRKEEEEVLRRARTGEDRERNYSDTHTRCSSKRHRTRVRAFGLSNVVELRSARLRRTRRRVERTLWLRLEVHRLLAVGCVNYREKVRDTGVRVSHHEMAALHARCPQLTDDLLDLNLFARVSSPRVLDVL